MIQLSHFQLEQALNRYRVARRHVLRALLDAVMADPAVQQKFLCATRMFGRLKSSDSIREKAARKGIEVRSETDVFQKFPDLLGFRIIADSAAELDAVQRIVKRDFNVLGEVDYRRNPNEFGGRGIDWELELESGDKSYRFELQARTFLQHVWATRSFHLFHKQKRERALPYQAVLQELGAALLQAEEAAARLEEPAEPQGVVDPACWSDIPLVNRVHLAAFESGERLLLHEIVTLSGNDEVDNERIVRRKAELYEQHPQDRYPKFSLVEASCFNFSTFNLNEPHIRVPLERFSIVQE